MSALPLPIFCLPSLLTEDILKNMGPFELFALSTLSARSERVIRAYSSRRQFKIRIDIDESYVLKLREPLSRAPKLTLEFTTSDSPGTVFRPAENAVQVFCEDVSEAMPKMLEKLSTIFKRNSIDLEIRVEDEKIKNRMNSVLQKHNLTVGDYYDSRNEYSYQEVENLMGSEWIRLEYPKLTDIQLRSIFKKCIDRPKSTNMTLQNVGTPDLFQKIASMVEGEKQIFTTLDGGHFRLTQDDRRFIGVNVTRGLVVINVTAKKFAFSTLSARSERVVKAYSSRRQFKVVIGIDENCVLTLREPRSRASELTIKFKISDNSGTVFCPARNTVQVFCEDVSEAMPWMLEHLSTTFKINSIDLVFKVKDEKIKDRINAVVQKLNLKVDDYYDTKNEYSCQEVESIMGTKWLHLKYPKLTDIQLRRLFKKCIDRPKSTNMTLQNVGGPDLFSKIASMVEGDKQIWTDPDGGYLQLTQEDGRFIGVTVGHGLVSIRVTVKK